MNMTWLAAKRYSGFCKKFTYTIQNYDLELKIDPLRHKYSATVSITMTVKKNTRQFLFLLSEQCQLTAVSYLGIAMPNKVKPVYPEINLVTAYLPRKADVGEKLVIVFTYTGHIPAQVGETMELAPQMHWYPFSLSPQKYTCTLKVVTPDSIRIIGVGDLTSEQPADTRVLTQWTATVPFRGIHMLAGDFLKTTRETQPPLDVYYPRKYMNQGKSVADNCEKLLDYYADRLGPAPSPSTAFILAESAEAGVVSSFFLTSVSGGCLDALREYKSSKERSVRMFLLTAREMAHRWLKLHLAVSHPSHLWYLDGLAEYLSWLSLEAEFDLDAREQIMNEARTLVLDQPQSSITQKAYGIRREFPSWLVAKAGWIMRVAHCLAGESFLPAIQEIYTQASQSQYAPSPEEFFLTLGNLTGKDMLQLYHEWAQSNTQLRAVITQGRTFQDDCGQWQLMFNLVNQGKLKWPHPMEIRMDLADGSTQLHNLCIQKEPHLIETAAKVNTLTVDPDLRILNWAEKNQYNM